MTDAAFPALCEAFGFDDYGHGFLMLGYGHVQRQICHVLPDRGFVSICIMLSEHFL